MEAGTHCDAETGLLYPIDEEGAWWRHKVCNQDRGNRQCPDKLVVAGPAAPIPLLSPPVTGIPAYSERPDEEAFRWQEIEADGTIRRRLDEYYTLGVRTSLVWYCPPELRVPDGTHACQATGWTEKATAAKVITEGDATIEKCAALTVDPTTCEVTTPVEGCTLETNTVSRAWYVQHDHETLTVPAGTFTDVVNYRLTDSGGTQRFWWARGVGKLREEDDIKGENEVLVDYCLPGACDRAPPTYAMRDAECDPTRACDFERNPAICLDPQLDPFPLQVGNWWKYRLRDPNTGLEAASPEKVWVVEANTENQVRMWVEGEGQKAGPKTMRLKDRRIEWVRRTDVDARGVITQNRTYDPPALRLDFSLPHSCVGDTWGEAYTTTTRQPGAPTKVTPQAETWSVLDVHAQPANAFLGPRESFCVERLSVPAPGGSTATGTYCFAYGIGKFVEQSEEEHEYLEAYCVGQAECCATAPTLSGVPRQMCGAECIDTQRNPSHCGACDRACLGTERCVDGACTAN